MNQLNIAIIGRTHTGKSSFLNGFRGIANNDPQAAITGAGVNPTHVRTDNQRFVIQTEDSLQINLFDINGFSDHLDTDVETQLITLREKCRVVT